MGGEFTYEKCEEYEGYVVYDSSFEPILETLEYIKTLDSWNGKKNAAVALKHWFAFLDQIGVNFIEAETKHIPKFRTWLKTPPEYRNNNKILIMHKEPYLENSSWMQYQSRVANFYSRYVKPKFPECKINFKEKVSYNPHSYGDESERYLFKNEKKTVSPLAKAIHPETFLKIQDCCTNNRDKLMLEFFYLSGIRRGELFNIEKDQFKHIPRGKEHPVFAMFIHDSYSPDANKQTKTGGREVVISTSLAEKISGYIDNTVDGRIVNKNKHHEIFTAIRTKNGTERGDPLSARYIYKIFKDAAKKAGCPQHTIHNCRHSYITNMFSRKVSVKDAMDQTGHKNPETLFRYRSKLDNIPEEVVLAIGEMDKQIRR